MVRPIAAKRTCALHGKPSDWPASRAHANMIGHASAKRHSTETSGATTPTCNRMPSQLVPHTITTSA